MRNRGDGEDAKEELFQSVSVTIRYIKINQGVVVKVVGGVWYQKAGLTNMLEAQNTLVSIINPFIMVH